MVGLEAGRDDDELRGERDQSPAARPSVVVHERHSDDLEQLGRLRRRRESANDEHVRAELGERVGDREAGDAETEDRDAQAASSRRASW